MSVPPCVRALLLVGVASDHRLEAIATSQVDQTKINTWVYGQSKMCEDLRCGANEWKTYFPACGEVGTQSPVNLHVNDEVYAVPDSEKLQLTEPPCTEAIFILDTHTVRVSIAPSCAGNSSLTHNGKVYNLVQWHYHSPSEHAFDGKHYPMEVHYVHRAHDGEGLVLAVPIGAGDSKTSSNSDEYMSRLFDHVPTPPASTGSNYHVKTSAWKDFKGYEGVPEQMKQASTQAYYRYDGSLTTPPCTSTVVWIISETPAIVSTKTIERYRKMINANPSNQVVLNLFTPNFVTGVQPSFWDEKLGCNNRPLQPWHGKDDATRVLYQMKSRSVPSAPLDAQSGFKTKNKQTSLDQSSSSDTFYVVVGGVVLLLVAIVVVTVKKQKSSTLAAEYEDASLVMPFASFEASA